MNKLFLARDLYSIVIASFLVAVQKFPLVLKRNCHGILLQQPVQKLLTEKTNIKCILLLSPLPIKICFLHSDKCFLCESITAQAKGSFYFFLLANTSNMMIFITFFFIQKCLKLSRHSAMVTVINHKKLIFFLSCFMFCDVNSSPCSCSEFHKHKASNVLLQSCGFLFDTCIALCQAPWPILHTSPPSNKNSTKINNTYCSTSHKNPAH